MCVGGGGGRILESDLNWLKNNGPCSNRRPGQEGIVDRSTICGNTVTQNLAYPCIQNAYITTYWVSFYSVKRLCWPGNIAM